MSSFGCAVSVIVSTFNRRASLVPALDALLAQTAAVPYEVIVVDNNSTDGTREVVRARESGRLRYVFEPRQGLPFARNAGIRAARAPILAFTDDDVMVGPGWVGAIHRVFDEHPDVDVIGGPVRPIWPGERPPWINPRQLGPFALGERGDRPIPVGAGNAALCLVGANFAFRREVFDRLGLFDTAFTKSQDREMQLRLWRAGGKGLYTPDLAIEVVVPADRLTKSYFRLWYSTYGVFHSRMRLLESLDRDGRLVDARGPEVLGVPLFLYRALLTNVVRWWWFTSRRRAAAAFFWENRARYLLSYIGERIWSHPGIRSLRRRVSAHRLFPHVDGRRTPAAP